MLSVYFGGGTPSIYSPGELMAVLDRLGGLWRVSPEAEVTVEVNPATWGAPEMLEAAAGFNRFSLGVQSFDDRVLRVLGRRHGAEESRELARLVPDARGVVGGLRPDLRRPRTGPRIVERTPWRRRWDTGRTTYPPTP